MICGNYSHYGELGTEVVIGRSLQAEFMRECRVNTQNIVSQKGMTLSISLFHAFSAEAIGFDQQHLIGVHDRPTIVSLERLCAAHRLSLLVEYFSSSATSYETSRGGTRWRFWPKSLRFRARSNEFGQEWSLPALAQLFLKPPKCILFPMSYQASHFLLLASVLCRIRGIPYYPIIGSGGVPNNRRQAWYLKRAATVFVHTHAAKQAFGNANYLRDVLVEVLPLGLDCVHFSPKPEAKPPQVKLLFVGRLLEQKGVHIAIETVSQLRKEFSEVTLTIVGPKSDEGYFTSLMSQIEKCGLESVITYVGPVPYDELPKYYQESTLLLMPSRTEGFGLVVTESMACATPVLALRDSGGPDEIISDGVDGALSTVGEFAGVAATLLRNPSHLASMGRRAREKVVALYSLDHTVDVLRSHLPAQLFISSDSLVQQN